MYKFILFDADNTLLDFDQAQYFSFRTVMEHYAIQYSDEIYAEYINVNHSLWNAFERGEIDTDYVQVERFRILLRNIVRNVDGVEANKIYQEGLKEQSQLMPYAIEACRELSSLSTLIVVTNGIGKTQKARIKKSKIAKYISQIVVSEDIGYQKPNINFFNEVFLMLNSPKPNEMLIIGDSLSSDIQGGINAGIHTCYYNPKSIDIHADIEPNYIIHDLRELVRIVQ